MVAGETMPLHEVLTTHTNQPNILILVNVHQDCPEIILRKVISDAGARQKSCRDHERRQQEQECTAVYQWVHQKNLDRR